jgi:hypothetical protein
MQFLAVSIEDRVKENEKKNTLGIFLLIDDWCGRGRPLSAEIVNYAAGQCFASSSPDPSHATFSVPHRTNTGYHYAIRRIRFGVVFAAMGAGASIML